MDSERSDSQRLGRMKRRVMKEKEGYEGGKDYENTIRIKFKSCLA